MANVEVSPFPQTERGIANTKAKTGKAIIMTMLKRATIGFAAGALATIPMTGEFWLAWRRGLIDEIPPHKAIRSVAPNLSEPRLSWVSAIAHLAVGGTAGAVYSALVFPRGGGTGWGILFGLGVWATGYEIVMPAATDIAPAHRDQKSRAATIFIAHVIFGGALGLFTALADRRH